MSRFQSLPKLVETLERFDLDPQVVFDALQEYRQLGTELLLEQEPQHDVFSFLRLRDQHDVVAAFVGLFTTQSPHLLFEKKDEEEDDDF